jgi:hypothetical protein
VIGNLALAGAHTKTDVDVWSIEAAVESGRRAAQVFEPSVKYWDSIVLSGVFVLRALDNLLYALGAPNASIEEYPQSLDLPSFATQQRF